MLKRSFNAIIAVLFFCCFSGCTTITVGDYIKSDHPYAKKIYGDYDKILAVVREVVARNGYKVTAESYPSVYERPVDLHTESPKDVLFFTRTKELSFVLFSTFSHLNIYVRSVAEGAEVEVRFEKVTSTWVNQIQQTRNDKLGKGILSQIEHAMLVQ